ncbi:glycoside hydrolase family 97 catalytic domain-containing protein [Isoptericola sp. NPDC057191]|uniref:glycoside hydrolase family 97 catalytic domain-containing protein n=1 Tax=Isoptericola sp. NPDC057191 TaxID=3346041 RepID=UPI003631A9D7
MSDRPAQRKKPQGSRSLAAPVTAVAVALGVIATAPGAAAESDTETSRWRVDSPTGSIGAEVTLAGGELDLAVRRDGRQVLSVGSLGLVTDVADLSTGLVVVAAEREEVRGSYSTTTGKERERTVRQDELRLRVTDGETRFDVVVRVADDGVAFRYELPATLGAQYDVLSEPARFALPAAADAWLQPYAPQYERAHTTTTAAGSEAGSYGFPATFRHGDDYVLLTESDVTGTYAASHLAHEAPGTPEYGLELYERAPVTAEGALRTPWRVAIAGSAADVVESTLVDDLARPSRIRDTSWIEPGMAAWSWITGGSTAAQGDLAFQKRFVDLAARNGWKYSLIDEGWDASWVPELVRYAQARDVEILAWFRSSTLWTKAQRNEWFDKLQDWGVKGIKVDFMDSDSQATFRWYDDIMSETADRHLLLNFHGSTIPKGLQRTWPHVMAYEGVRGEEQYKDEAWAVNNTILPFTRNVVGSMDYTPAMFSRISRTSKAHELALPVVYESGFQHVVDSPEGYAAEPVAERFLQQVPTAWDETRFVSGEPGSSAVVARRAGTRWFIGGITSGDPGTVDVPLTMLGKGSWLVHQITDDGRSLVEKVTTRTATDVMTVPTSKAGGFVLLACRARSGQESCYQAVPETPRTQVLVDADATTVEAGDRVTVQGIFAVRQGGPVRDLSLDVELPRSWTLVSGKPVTRQRLGDGQTITGRWTVRVGRDGPVGGVDLPVVGTFETRDGRTIRSGDAARLDVLPPVPQGDVWVSELPFTEATTGFGEVTRDVDLNGEPIDVGGSRFEHGIVTHAPATVAVRLGGQCTTFSATPGIEPGGDHPEEGSVTFTVLGDGVPLATVGSDADPVTVETAAEALEVDVTGVENLTLQVGDAGDGKNNDHAAWGDARLHCA